ncbi:MAG: enoyl-CoA hydratase/isomerase family protein [Candidatus Helarchaeota archaeon]
MIEDEFKLISFEIKRKVGILTLNNGDLNIFNRELIYEFRDLLKLIKNDPKLNKKVRVLVIKSASDKAFSAGFDLKAAVELDESVIKLFLVDGKKFIYDLTTMPIPTIALVNGYAIGIGFLIPVACDFRFCTDDSQFQLPEIIYEGMFPTHGACTNLPKIVNKLSDAKYLLFTGDRINAETAVKMGIIDRCFKTKDEMIDEGIKFGKVMSTKNPLTMQLIKAALNTCSKSSISTGMQIETEAFKIIKNTSKSKFDLKNGFISKYLEEL